MGARVHPSIYNMCESGFDFKPIALTSFPQVYKRGAVLFLHQTIQLTEIGFATFLIVVYTLT
jgi:hypothetical protein